MPCTDARACRRGRLQILALLRQEEHIAESRRSRRLNLPCEQDGRLPAHWATVCRRIATSLQWSDSKARMDRHSYRPRWLGQLLSTARRAAAHHPSRMSAGNKRTGESGAMRQDIQDQDHRTADASYFPDR